MTQAEINTASTEDLQETLAQIRKNYAELKMTHAVSPLENPMQIRMQRRAIARIATELTKRNVQ